MAKVSKPLLSGDARGQIGKTLVFMGWKGIKDVRSYVVPANPKSPDQLTQRGYFKDAVSKFHDGMFTDADKSSHNLIASIQAKPMSGFNWFVKTFVFLKADGKMPFLVSLTDATKDATNLTLDFNVEGTHTLKVFMGGNYRLLSQSEDLTLTQKGVAEGKYTYEGSLVIPLINLEGFTNIYFQIVDTVDDAALSGIWKYTL